SWAASDAFLLEAFAELDGALVATGVVVEEEGTHALVVTARDRAGNETVASASFTLDHTAPVIVITGVTEGALLSPPAAAEIDVSDDNLATATVSLDGAPYASGAELPPGDHVVDVKAVDLAGNLAQQTVAFRVEPPRRATAVLSDGGLPVADALVFLHTADG